MIWKKRKKEIQGFDNLSEVDLMRYQFMTKQEKEDYERLERKLKIYDDYELFQKRQIQYIKDQFGIRIEDEIKALYESIIKLEDILIEMGQWEFESEQLRNKLKSTEKEAKDTLKFMRKIDRMLEYDETNRYLRMLVPMLVFLSEKHREEIEEINRHLVD